MSLRANSLMIWGHRGHRHHRYAGQYGLPAHVPHENTLEAYRQVLRHGTGVEADVVQSLEHTPYLVHDTLFNGITKYDLKSHLDEAGQALAQDRFIFQMTTDEVDGLCLRDGQEIPRLYDLLKIMPEYPGRKLNLEMKGPHVTDHAVRVVEHAIRKKLIQPQQVIFSSYSLPALQNLRLNVGQRFRIAVMLMPDNLALSPMFPNWPHAEQNAYYVPFSLQALQRAEIREIEPDYLYLETRSVTDDMLDYLREHYRHTRLLLWCMGERHPKEDDSFASMVERLAPSRMVAAVISDFPLAMQEILLERQVNIRLPEPALNAL